MNTIADARVFLGQKKFKIEDQKKFVTLSGDKNPIHFDYNYSRRTPIGQPIVHGINSVLWALDLLFCKFPEHELAGADVKFSNPIFLYETVGFWYYPTQSRIKILRSSIELVTIKLKLSADAKLFFDCEDEVGWHEICEKAVPTERQITDVARDDKFYPPMYVNTLDHNSPFRHCLIRWGIKTVRDIINLSAIVGMFLPGKNSIFSGLKIDFSTRNTSRLIEVTTVDPRFNLCDYSVFEKNFTANISSIFRKPTTIGTFLPVHPDDTYSHWDLTGKRILVLGGTRGLGEQFTMLSAMAGANVLFSYNDGKIDADRLADKLQRLDCQVKATHFNVETPSLNILSAFQPEIIFFMITPPIFIKRTREFEVELFDKFISFYCTTLEKLCEKLTFDSLKLLYYPSSIAIETDRTRNFEYSVSKQLGEIHAEVLSKKYGFELLVDRLPRLKTDQTSTHLKIKASDVADVALQVMVRVVKSLHEADQLHQ